MSFTPEEWAKHLRARNIRAIQALHNFLEPYRNPDGSYKYGAFTRAGKAFGVTRQNIYQLLDEHPESPERVSRKKRMEPAYAMDFEKTAAVKRMKELKKGIKRLSSYLSVGKQAWIILNKKDPATWDIDDYKLLWNHPKLADKKTGKIAFNKAVALRQWMEVAKLYDLKNSQEFDTRGLKREKGAKLTHWISEEQQFIDVINAFEYPDTLQMFNLGIQCGARHSSLKLIKPGDIMYSLGSIKMRETKTKQTLQRDFLPDTLETLRYYIQHFNFKIDDKIFPRSLNKINEDLKQAGEKAGIDFDLTTHVGMKHTFVSFASLRGVSLEAVSTQTGTDPSTLMQFYAGTGKKKVRAELLGEPAPPPNWHHVMLRLQPIVRARFEAIKDAFNKKTKSSKTPKKRKPRKLNWSTVEKLVKTESTPEPIKKAWKKALALHRKGLSDAEVKKEMGWKP